MKQKEQAPLMLSVSGARGIVGVTMTPTVAAEYAGAFGTHVKVQGGGGETVMCVGRDSRPSGAMLAQAAMAGLAGAGCRVVDLGVVTTPTVAVMIGQHKAKGGMCVTASHNPIEWNGLKCLNADGIAPPPETANEVIQRFKEKDIEWAAVRDVGGMEADGSGHKRHVELVLGQVDVEAIRRAKIGVVLDSVNGAGCVAGRMLLEALGCTVTHLNGEPTGYFAHTPEPVEDNLKELASQTRNHGASVGFAQDPDADRLAVVDEGGRFIGEEYTLVLAAKRMLDAATGGRGGASSLRMAANLSTSRMIDDLAAKYTGAKVMRTAVGEANVVAAMKPAGALIGGEGNGGVILPGVCWVRDSLSAMALVLWLMAVEGKPVSEIVAELPRYKMIKHKYDLKDVGGTAAVKGALEKVAKRFADQRVSTLDGVRVDYEDGWVHLRASNTEPIVRLIAEAGSDSRAWEIIDETAVAAGLR